MPISSFRLKSTIGRNYKTDFNDTLRTKEALRHLGYYEEPPYGMTGYPDEALFNSIEKFQNDHGLRRDGILKPGGETEGAIRVSYTQAPAPRENESEQDKGIQVAGAGALIGHAARIVAPLVLAPLAIESGRKLGRWYDGENGFDASDESERTSIVDQAPQKNTHLPPPKIDNKEEFPAMPTDIPDLEGRPINEALKNDPVIFQAVRDEIIKELQKPVHAHRGDERTVTGNTITVTDIIPKVLAKYGPEKANSYRHIGGANDKDGKPLKEIYIPNIDTGGREGSSNADLTIEVGQDRHHFNTGKTLRDGRTGIASERRDFVKLGKNIGSELAGFLPKLRPGMDMQDWYERTYRLVEEYFERIYGPPSK